MNHYITTMEDTIKDLIKMPTNQPLITICTHDGYFHEDEVTAVAVLSRIFTNHEIIRTRDVSAIAMSDISVDVGDVYDHSTRRYDHHMTNPPTDDNGHILSSAGLIWRHYADTYLKAIGIPKNIIVDGIPRDVIGEVKRIMKDKWITPIDLVDNGVISGPTILSETVRSMRPIRAEMTRATSDIQFKKAVGIVGTMLERTCFHHAESVISRYTFLESEKRIVDDIILVCETPPDHIGSFCDTDIHFVIHPIKPYADEDDLQYIINPIPIAPKRNFKTPIRSDILGKRYGAIEEVTKLSGIEYIHHNGFMILAKDEESAIAFCRYIIANQ